MGAAIKSAVNGLGAPNISALTAMVSAGGAPASPPLIDALDNSSADYGHRGENAEPGRPADDAGVAPNTRSEYQEGSSPRPGESGESGDASSGSKDSTDFGQSRRVRSLPATYSSLSPSVAARWRCAVDARHGRWWRDGHWWGAEYAGRSGWRRHVRSVV